jgi:hypothetical protein
MIDAARQARLELAAGTRIPGRERVGGHGGRRMAAAAISDGDSTISAVRSIEFIPMSDAQFEAFLDRRR